MSEWQRIVRGIFLAVLLAIAIITISYFLLTILLNIVTSSNAAWVNRLDAVLNAIIFCIGVTQLFYIIPLSIASWTKRRFALMKGLIIGAVIIALVNFGFFVYILSRFGDR
ncbi:hypothetical protein IQ250_27790 [Pseudanabaenaceae cyanobacterium LEGE 13415]|nr:hypothetical protein [Pseudanabaenaceae cyanobacterium LEGE 13415]